MPYISREDDRRERLRNGEPALIAGELNYQIFHYFKNRFKGFNFEEKYVKKFVQDFLGDNPNYQKYNDMTGALTRCSKEIRRRFFKIGEKQIIAKIEKIEEILKKILNNYDDEIAKYEDTKIEQNGDVE